MRGKGVAAGTGAEEIGTPGVVLGLGEGSNAGVELGAAGAGAGDSTAGLLGTGSWVTVGDGPGLLGDGVGLPGDGAGLVGAGAAVPGAGMTRRTSTPSALTTDPRLDLLRLVTGIGRFRRRLHAETGRCGLVTSD